MKKLLTIGMATYDDYDGVYFTIQALRMYHPICRSNEVEFVIVDNNPDGAHGKEILRGLGGWLKPQLKYVPFSTNVGTSCAKNEIFKHATGEYTLVIDGHVLIEADGIKNLLKYYIDNPDTSNLIQGPLTYDDLTNQSTHFKEEWGSGMLGKWATNKPALLIGDPFEIPMQGMGLFSCKTDKWPEFNPHFKGFGAEEGYIHEKIRQAGGKCICLPQLGWVHRFARPNGITYPNKWQDRLWNYLVGWMELTRNPNHEIFEGIRKEFSNKVADTIYNDLFAKAKLIYKL